MPACCSRGGGGTSGRICWHRSTRPALRLGYPERPRHATACACSCPRHLWQLRHVREIEEQEPGKPDSDTRGGGGRDGLAGEDRRQDRHRERLTVDDHAAQARARGLQALDQAPLKHRGVHRGKGHHRQPRRGAGGVRATLGARPGEHQRPGRDETTRRDEQRRGVGGQKLESHHRGAPEEERRNQQPRGCESWEDDAGQAAIRARQSRSLLPSNRRIPRTGLVLDNSCGPSGARGGALCRCRAHARLTAACLAPMRQHFVARPQGLARPDCGGEWYVLKRSRFWHWLCEI